MNVVAFPHTISREFRQILHVPASPASARVSYFAETSAQIPRRLHDCRRCHATKSPPGHSRAQERCTIPAVQSHPQHEWKPVALLLRTARTFARLELD